MGSSSQPAPAPQQQPSQTQPQIIPPTVPVPAPGANYSIQQFTQVNQQMPATVWTTDLAEKFMHLLKDNDDKNRSALERGYWREFSVWIFGLAITACITGVALWFIYRGISVGTNIILGVLTFLAGMLAGRGTKK